MSLAQVKSEILVVRRQAYGTEEAMTAMERNKKKQVLRVRSPAGASSFCFVFGAFVAFSVRFRTDPPSFRFFFVGAANGWNDVAHRTS